MPGVEISTQIAAPPETVWRLLSDASRYAEWVDPTDRMVDVPAGEMKSGFGDDGSMRFHLDNILEARDGGTLFTQKLKMSPRPWIAPVAYLTWPLFMKKRANASIRKTQENLKKLLESSIPA